MAFSARPYILQEANLTQLRALAPNVAVLPWGATEGHGYHLPYGTDNVEGTSVAEAAVARAYDQGAKVVLLPTVPFGIDHTQLNQVATITMRASTQQAVLRDVAQSLVTQGIDRLVLLNFHGGNDFKSMIRDIMFDLPIFIVQVHGWQTASFAHLLEHADGDHADEFETSLMMHLTPDWVTPLEQFGDGARTASQLPALTENPGVWLTRDWAALTESTGVGDPRQATAEKGRQIFELLVGALTPILVELSRAKNGDFPFVIKNKT